MVEQVITGLGRVDITDIANFSSIAGLILTLLVFVSVRKIARFYLVRIRVPELAKKLKRNASKLAEYLNNFRDSRFEIDLELAKSATCIKLLARRLDPSTKRAARQVRRQLLRYRRFEPDEDRLRKVYVNLYTLIQEIEEYQKELKWSR